MVCLRFDSAFCLWALQPDDCLFRCTLAVRETIQGTLERQQARDARRQAKALSQASSATAASSLASGGAATTLGRANSVASSPAPSQASTSSGARHKHSLSAAPGLGASSMGEFGSSAGPPPQAPSAGTNGLGIRSARGSVVDATNPAVVGGRNGSLSSHRDSHEGQVPDGGPSSARGSLGAISEQRTGANSRSPSLSGQTTAHARIPAANGSNASQRLPAQSAMSQSVFAGRDGRKSTSSGRLSKSGLENMLGLDPAKTGGAGDVEAQQFEREGPDEFEAALKGGGTKKMSLTPVVMKRTEVRAAARALWESDR